jgi:hypothetical protein
MIAKERGRECKEDAMTSGSLILTKREFILMSAAGIAAPLLTNHSALASEPRVTEDAKAANKSHADYQDPKCNGCQVCRIFFSNCLAVNNRLCWCDPAGSD